MSRQQSPQQHFDRVEHELTKDLVSGHDINAACLLLKEFQKNPEEARALVKRAMALPNADTMSHIGIDPNGDVMVWDSTGHSAVYGGNAPDLAPKKECPPDAAPLPNVEIQQAPPADAAAVPAPVPPPAEALDSPPPPPPPLLPLAAGDHPEVPAPAVCVEEHRFKGLNLGLVRVGVYDHKSFGLGVNVGIGKADGMIGGHTGGDVRVGLPQLGACAAAGVDIDENGLHAGGKTRVNVANLVGGGAETGAGLGPVSYAHAEADAEALGAHTKVEDNVTANDQGVFYNHTANAGFLNWVGVSSKAHANISADSSVGSSVKGYIGPASVEVGSGVETDHNTVLRGGGYVDFGSGTEHGTLHGEAQVGPSLDVRGSIGATNHDDANPSKWQSGSLQAGIGASGFGLRAIDANNDHVKVSPIGVGPDYQPSDTSR